MMRVCMESWSIWRVSTETIDDTSSWVSISLSQQWYTQITHDDTSSWVSISLSQQWYTQITHDDTSSWVSISLSQQWYTQITHDDTSSWVSISLSQHIELSLHLSVTAVIHADHSWWYIKLGLHLSVTAVIHADHSWGYIKLSLHLSVTAVIHADLLTQDELGSKESYSPLECISVYQFTTQSVTDGRFGTSCCDASCLLEKETLTWLALDQHSSPPLRWLHRLNIINTVFINCLHINPLTPTVAIWYSYKASCARLG